MGRQIAEAEGKVINEEDEEEGDEAVSVLHGVRLHVVKSNRTMPQRRYPLICSLF